MSTFNAMHIYTVKTIRAEMHKKWKIEDFCDGTYIQYKKILLFVDKYANPCELKYSLGGLDLCALSSLGFNHKDYENYKELQSILLNDIITKIYKKFENQLNTPTNLFINVAHLPNNFYAATAIWSLRQKCDELEARNQVLETRMNAVLDRLDLQESKNQVLEKNETQFAAHTSNHLEKLDLQVLRNQVFEKNMKLFIVIILTLYTGIRSRFIFLLNNTKTVPLLSLT